MLVAVRAWPRACLLVVGLGALMLGAQAAPQAKAQPLPKEQALGWLQRISAAADQRSYRGTMVFSTEGVVSSSRVAHFCDGKDYIERVEALDGRQQRVYRHNDLVHTVWPQQRLVVIERREASAGLVSIRRAVDERALASYELSLHGHERVAGRMAQVLRLQPRDTLRYAQRLWADLETGLLLRSDVIGHDARVLESAAFGEIDLDSTPSPARLLEGMRPKGFRSLPARSRVVELLDQGWELRASVPGFELMGCLRRPRADDAGAELLQLVFSDGLSFASVFVEPFDADRHREALTASLGATGTLMRRQGQHWLTATGDVPLATLEQLLRALAPRR